MNKELTIYTDGGSRGNPGPAAIGYVIQDNNGQTIETGSKFIGTKTNNEAEYMALISALKQASKLNADTVNVFADSELIIKQVKKEYRVRQPHLQLLLNKVENLIKNFNKVTFTHIKRKFNKEADSLVNQTLDNHKES